MLKYSSKLKKTLIILVIILLLSLFAMFMLPESYEDWMINFVSYENIRDSYKYDHIVYNGVPYYYLASDYNVPDEYVPFDSEKVYITIVDPDGEAYDKSIKEEAWIYKNDEDVLFIYFQSAPFTRDVRYVSEHYKFD